MIALSAVLASIAVLLLCLLRLFGGPTLYDRVIAANAGGLCVIVIAAGLAIWSGDARALDVSIALVFAMVVANVAFFKFSYAKTFQSAIARTEEAP
jgi:multicomponent Na+:H+ antiporter subunit F